MLFDVFGTLVDWRASGAAALERWGRKRGVDVDWLAFVDAWRAEYIPSMDRVRRGEVPWRNLDALHAESFDRLSGRFGLPSLTGEERRQCVAVWHYLEPWPDVRAGLARLRADFVVGTLSNGNVALQVDLARHGDLRFDVLFSAEHFRHYKPDAQTYLGAVALLGLEPREVMLVAAHNGDLAAAAASGLGTAFVARPAEYGPHQQKDLAPDAGADVGARDLLELAEKLALGSLPS